VVTVEIFRSDKGISGYRVSGHAMGTERSEEFDLVCGAVSVLVLTITNGLTEVLKVEPEVLEVGESGGLVHCILPRGLDSVKAAQVDALLETLAMGLAQIADSYPRYVRLKQG